MKTLAFYVDLGHDMARRAASDAAAVGRELGYRIAMCDQEAEDFNIADEGATIEHAELVVTVGGDGTLLRGARIAYPYDLPVLGINTGRLGFLTEIEGNGETAAEVRALLTRGFDVEERSALEATVEGGESFVALNDVVVHKGGASRIVPFGLDLDGEHVADLPADGIVIATPTGSTAYFLSAGGPIISPGVDAFGIAALLPHTLFARPLIVSANATIGITLDSEFVHAHLETDGVTVAELVPGDRVTIRRAPKPIRFARGGPMHYFSRLEQKLRWGVSIRGTSR